MQTPTTWIRNNLELNALDKIAVYELYQDFIKEFPDSYELDTYKRTVRKIYNTILEEQDDPTNEAELLVKSEASRQGLRDTSNVLRKVNRETFRVWNVLEGMYSEYKDLLTKIDLTSFKIQPHKPITGNKCGILHLSDLHLNEEISPRESFGNTFNFTVASKRLKKYVTESLELFRFYKISTVTILLSGDIINSNRRLTEKFAAITSQSRASLLATYLLQQVILEVAQEFSVTIEYVIGNESRIGDVDWASDTIMASENWDHLIVENLRLIFKGTDVKFNKPDSLIETVFTLPNGFKGLLFHGNTLKGSGSTDKSASQILMKYIMQGTKINGGFSGHIHSAMVSDVFSRSSSLCGANAYSSQDLHFVSRASQNCYIADKDHYTGIKIDVQNVNEYPGYEIIEELEYYDIHGRSGNMEVVIRNLV